MRVLVLGVLAVSLLALSPVEVAGAQVDVTAPVVVSGPTITSSPANGDTYGAGESVEFSVTFSEPVTVTGEPRLRFVMRDQQRRARFARVAADGTTVVYSYTVRGSDVDVDGISVKADQLRMAHGMIVDADDNAADLTHDALADQSGHKVDGAAPVVVSGPTVTSRPANGDTYVEGESVRFAVIFSEPVILSGTPILRVMVGGKRIEPGFAGWIRSSSAGAGAGGETLLFDYAVQAGDVDADGVSVRANQLRMMSGSIVDAAGNAARLAHGALADQSGHKVDTVAPVVVSRPAVTSSPANGEIYGKGESVRFAVTFSEPVTVTGEPRLRFRMGDKLRRSRFSRVAADGATLEFSYTVRANDADINGISVRANQLRLAGGTIVDTAGNAAELTHRAMMHQQGHKADGGGDKADPLSTPTNLAAAVSVTSASVTWDATTGGKRDGSLSYRLEYKLAARNWDVATTRTTTDRSVLLENLSPGNYEVRLRATDSAGQSPYTPAVSFKVHRPPPTPTGVAVRFVGHFAFLEWDEPAKLDGIDRYRVQWRWVNEEFDNARSVAVPLNAPKWQGKFSQNVSGRLYRVRVVAEGPGGTAASGAVLVRTTESVVYDMIERRVVAEYQDTHGWIRETWAYITDPSFRIEFGHRRGFLHILFQVVSELPLKPLSRGIAKYIGGNASWTSDYYANGYVHEMAHVWSLDTGVTANPAPIGVALLYFERRARESAAKTKNKGCRAEELFADALTLHTPAQGSIIYSPYWASGQCTGGQKVPDKAALDVVAAASRGEMPAWLRNANSDGNGNLDLTGLWEDLTNFGDHRSDSSMASNVQHVIAYHLRDAFGGYCNDYLARYSYEGRTKGITNPWRDGGCTPGAPTGVQATPGDGSLAVSWTAPAQTGVSDISSYIVQYKASNESYSTQRQVTVTGDTTSATISGLRNGETYTVRVIAVNLMDDYNQATTNDGWSNPSPEVSASPASS